LRNRIIAIHLFIVAILVGRRPEAVFKAQFWAEDGAVFFAEQLRMGFWHAVINPYSGYLHVAPRILAGLFSGLRVQALPTAYGISSIIVAAFCCSAFSWPTFRWLISSDLLRFLCCVIMATALPTGAELIGSITNMQWLLAPVGILIVFSEQHFSHGRWRAIATLLLLVLIALSAPGLFVVMPLFIWQAIRGRDWQRWKAFAVVLTLGVQGLEVIHTRAGGGKANWNFDSVLISTIASGTTKCILVPMFGNAFLLAQSVRSLIAAMLLTLIISLILFVWMVSKVPHRVVLLSAAYIGVASVAVVMGGRNLAPAFLVPKDIPHVQGERYFFLGGCVLIFVVGFAADFLAAQVRDPLLRRVPAMIMLLIFGVGMVQNYQTPPLVDLSWASYAGQIEDWTRRHDGAPLVVPLNPPPFNMTLIGQQSDKR
jgi:hypothetical protein